MALTKLLSTVLFVLSITFMLVSCEEEAAEPEPIDPEIDTNAPSHSVFVIFDMGQSNAIGRAEAKRLALTTFPAEPAGVSLYYKSDYSTSPGHLQAYQAGVNSVEPDQPDTLRTFSHSLPLAVKLRDYTGNRCYIIPAGDGNTALEQNVTTPDWSPASSGECFEIFMQRFYNKAMDEIIAANPAKTIRVVILWSQGESDASYATATSDYAANFDTFYASVRGLAITHQAYISAAPWIVGKINFLKSANESTINTAFDAFAAGTGKEKLFTIDLSGQKRKTDLTAAEKGGYTPTAFDDGHLSYLAHIYFAEQALTRIKNFYGWTVSDPQEVTRNTAFDPSTITSSGVRLQMSRNEVTIAADNKITNCNNALGSTDFTVVSTGDAPRFKIDQLKGAFWFSPRGVVHRIESNAAIGTSLFAGSWSTAFWVKPVTATSGIVRTIWHDIQNPASVNNSRASVSIDENGRIYGFIAVGGTLIQFRTANAVWSGTQGDEIFDWKHISVTADNVGHLVKIYVNGVLQTMDATLNGDISSINLANYVNATNKFQIGARREGASNYDQFLYSMIRELTVQPGVVYSTTDITNLMKN